MKSGFLINSLPKSGTNLVDKAIQSIPELPASKIHLGYISFRGKGILRKLNSFFRFQAIDQSIAVLNASQTYPDQERTSIRLGIVGSRYVDQRVLSNVLQFIKRRGYATAHIPYSIAAGRLFEENQVKMLLVMRDPRDVVVSQTYYLKQEVNHFLFDEYQQMSFNQALTASILGYKNISSSIRERIEMMQPWIKNEKNLLVIFENLIGPEGGGTLHLQDAELIKILDFFEIELNRYSRERILTNLFGGTSTFRRGQTGSWRDTFNPKIKNLFKEHCGDYLIELGYEIDFDW